jgi:hypothetical protein|tara:strand:- start:370 stop:813 length:444 start_codon:yes stop_codon:yes gene_type:complete
MNKEQLKKTLRPLIKECIKEVIFEEGVLSGIISEVVKGTGTQQIVETRQPQSQYQQMHRQDHENRQRKIQENRQKMLDSIGRDAYNGVDLFEGTQPLSSRGTAGASTGRGAVPQGAKALDGIAPNDPGVNLAALGVNPGIWKTLAGK